MWKTNFCIWRRVRYVCADSAFIIMNMVHLQMHPNMQIVNGMNVFTIFKIRLNAHHFKRETKWSLNVRWNRWEIQMERATKCSHIIIIVEWQCCDGKNSQRTYHITSHHITPYEYFQFISAQKVLTKDILKRYRLNDLFANKWLLMYSSKLTKAEGKQKMTQQHMKHWSEVWSHF